MANTPLIIEEYRLRTKRLTLLCELVETYPNPAERKGMILRLYEAGMISDGCCHLMLEAYELERA